MATGSVANLNHPGMELACVADTDVARCGELCLEVVVEVPSDDPEVVVELFDGAGTEDGRGHAVSSRDPLERHLTGSLAELLGDAPHDVYDREAALGHPERHPPRGH